MLRWWQHWREQVRRDNRMYFNIFMGVMTNVRRELLLGAGSNHERKVKWDDRQGWDNLTTLDALGKPDVRFNLIDIAINLKKLPFEDETFDEIHAYDVLEHTGWQGFEQGFFTEFTEYHRILKPGGYLAAICPSYRSRWAWGDPGHRRVLTSGTLAFLNQSEYEKQVGVTSMSDYRHLWKGNFQTIYCDETDESLVFVLQKVG